ncbi:MAG: nitrate reductase subunit alpha, partial [Nitrospirales bacterium]|nr:nitrate reductase subunit alpha [Nitrospirales bacterium]
CARLLERYEGEENGDWKFLVFDTLTGEPRMPQGAVGHRWQKKPGQWNLEMKDGHDGSPLDPALTLLSLRDDVLEVSMTDFSSREVFCRGVPVKYVVTGEGKVPVTTVFDLLCMQFGLSRGLPGDYPADYYDDKAPYTPAWQEMQTGVDRAAVIRFAREWAATAERTKGKCTLIVGSGVNHWYHSNLSYRAAITSLLLCGCVGVNGGGLNHYTGQEKIVPHSSWSAIAFASDWIKTPRLQNTPSFHYVHTAQWRYESGIREYRPGEERGKFGSRHCIDHQIKAVRRGWLPFYPQFDRNPLDLAREAEEAGIKDDGEIAGWIAGRLKSGTLRFAVEDPDAPENWPRVWLIWRANALLSSAKGHEYFLKHYLGTDSNAIAKEAARDTVREVNWRDPAPTGKLDLVVDINFRMDTTAVYSDIVLPAATWYEKDDLNTTDLHSYFHPLSAAVPPCWESKSDWEIFKTLAEKISETAKSHFPEPVRDIVTAPLKHDTPDEISQREVKDWHKDECEPIPGKTMPHIGVVERDYANIYRRFVSLGHAVKEEGMEIHGIRWPVGDLYEQSLKSAPRVEWGCREFLSLAEARDAADIILSFAPESNGEMAFRAFRDAERQSGVPLADLAEKYRGVRYDFGQLVEQPRRILTSPCWSGITNGGRAYAPYCINTERLLPWRTLTGRQHLYLDHEGYLAFGEHLPTFKPKIDPESSHDLIESRAEEGSLLLNCITPHGKWHIHTTYSETPPMLTLSRGIEPLWLNHHDAGVIGVEDNDWVEIYNDHGVVVTRAVVSARVPRGIGIYYHVAERTLDVPKSPLRGGKRAGSDNSLTRTRMKPLFMIGGYAQFSYDFNYWGPPNPDRDTYVRVRKLEGKPQW